MWRSLTSKLPPVPSPLSYNDKRRNTATHFENRDLPRLKKALEEIPLQTRDADIMRAHAAVPRVGRSDEKCTVSTVAATCDDKKGQCQGARRRQAIDKVLFDGLKHRFAQVSRPSYGSDSVAESRGHLAHLRSKKVERNAISLRGAVLLHGKRLTKALKWHEVPPKTREQHLSITLNACNTRNTKASLVAPWGAQEGREQGMLLTRFLQ